MQRRGGVQPVASGSIITNGIVIDIVLVVHTVPRPCTSRCASEGRSSDDASAPHIIIRRLPSKATWKTVKFFTMTASELQY